MNAIQPNPEKNLAEVFTDPITLEVITDPVIDKCGHTFERAQVVGWIQDHHTCPISRNKLESDELISNRVVKEAITIINSNGGLQRKAGELNVPPREQHVVEEAAQMLHPRTFAKAAGDCVEHTINIYYCKG